jgi:hypothetical protein
MPAANFSCLLDGWVKPGHDNEAHGSYFHTRDGGDKLLNLLRLKCRSLLAK